MFSLCELAAICICNFKSVKGLNETGVVKFISSFASNRKR